MRTLLRLLARVRNFLTRHRAGGDRLREEIESHLAAQTEENVRASMAPGEARRQARVKFGAVEAVRAGCHDEAGLPFLEDLFMDVRYALRGLARAPAFTLTATLTLMLAIGANVVVFGVFNAVLLHPLAVDDPAGLYQLRLQRWTSFKLLTTSYPVFEDLRRANTAFRGLAGFYGYAQAILRSGDAALPVSGYAVTGNYFDLLGVQPQVGRFFGAADEHGPDSAPFVVLSDNLWRRAFNADPGVVGTTVRLYNEPFTIVGVAPARFHGTEQFVWPDYWIPILNYFEADYLQSRTSVAVTVLGRLKPGVTPRQATEDLNGIAARLATEYPETDVGSPLRLIRPGLYGDNGDVIRGFLYGVSVLALLVLAAACANLASLFAARASDRRRELALRVALGAGPGRLARQLLTEAMVVALLGGAAGWVGAGWLLGLFGGFPIPSFLAHSPYSRLAVEVDARVYLSALILTLASGLVCGMIPARQAGQISPLAAMKGGAVNPVRPGGLTARDGLLVAQIAICTLLVAASIVAVRGMVRLLRVPLGFQPRGAMLAEVDLSEVTTGGDVPLARKQAVLDALRGLPGVTAAGTLNKVPFTGGLRSVPVFPPGATGFKLTDAVLAPYVFTMSPGYLEAAGTRLLRGRDVSWHDTAGTPFVAVVNATFARKLWGDETSAVGQRFIVSGHLTEVVGVAEDGKYYELQEPPQPAVFLPLPQNEGAYTVFVVRSSRAQNEMAAAMTRTLSAIEPNAPVSVRGWPEAMGGVLFAPRAATATVSVMGLLAAMLAVTGIFGMATYNVSRRMKELGIRVALGAPKTHVMRAAVGRPMALLGIGSLAGLLLGVLASRWLGRIVVPQADAQDLVALGGAMLTMTLLGVAASTVPVLRALAADPAKLMREE